MPKRSADAPAASPDAKKAAPDVPKAKQEPDTARRLEEFKEMQKQLQDVDRECMREQMAIQRKFDEKKAPLMSKRNELIDKIEQFWAVCISKHSLLSSLITAKDYELLEAYLKKVDIKDNIDDNGSYEITFVFDKSAPFTPVSLTKKVVFDQAGREVVESCTVTAVEFTDPKMDPRPTKQSSPAVAEEEDDTDGFGSYSLFNWFEEADVAQAIWSDFGDLFRRDLWPDPLEYFFKEDSDSEFEDDEDDEDETKESMGAAQ